MAYGVRTQLNMADIAKSRQQFEKHLKDMQELANKNVVQIRMNNVNNQLNETRRSFEGINTQTQSLGQNMGNVVKKIAQYTIGASLILGTIREIKGAIQEIASINKSNVDIAMITGDTVANVQRMNPAFLQMANNLKVVNSEVHASEAEWLRSGVSIDEANKNTETNIKLARVSGLSNKEVAESLIVLKNAYDLTTDGVEKTSNKIALLDTQSATSSAKIMTAMAYTAQTAKEAGLSEDFLLGNITTILERSKQGAEATGRAVKSILLNFKKLQDGEDIEGLSKLEDILGKQGIALRTSEKDWRNVELVMKDLQKVYGGLDDITQTQIQTLLGGKNQAEQFNIMMKESARVGEFENKVKKDSNALNEAHAKTLDSIQAKQAVLSNASTEFWGKVISSSAIKSGIDSLTEVVRLVQFLTVENKALGATIAVTAISILLVSKHMSTLKYAIGECGAMFSLLRTEGIGALAALNFNPVILAISAVVLAVGAITYSQYEHRKEVRKLTEEYDVLSKSMNELDGRGIKENTEKLKEQKEELEKLVKIAKESPDMDMGMGYKSNAGQENLEKYIKTLEEAGFHVDENTHKIIELSIAEENIATTDSIQAIQDKTNTIISESSETQSLISQYMNLSQQENLSAEKKKMLTNLTNQLTGRIGGLTTSVDIHGNSVITNTGYLTKNIDILELLKQQSIMTGNAEIEMAINSSSAIHDGTVQTLDDLKAKLQGYQALSSALSNTSAGKGGFFKTQLVGLDMGIKKLEGSIGKIESLKRKFNMKAPMLTGITSSNPTGYKPSAEIDKVKESTKGLTEAEKLLTAETKRATNANKDYETAMKSLSIQLKAQDISLGKLNENSSKYRSGLEKKAQLLKADIKLTEQSIITNTKNAKALVNIEGKPNTSNTISSKNVASSAGQAVVDEAKKYLGTPYVWGGTNQEGFDCSGLVQFVYKKLGKDISRTTTTQINEGSKIAKKDLQVGDTVFFGNPSEPHHEGIYVGNGQYLHAPRTGDVVKISDLNSRSDFAGARRMVSGGTSIPSEIQGFMGDSTTDGSSDKILTEIENQRSHLVDVREELDKLKIEVLKSKVGVFDEQVAIYDKYINLNKAKSERFEVGSKGHTKAMNDELQAMTNKYINLTKKTQLLNEEIKSGGYDEKTVSDLKNQLLDTDSAYLDIYNNIRTLTKEIYANAFAENDKLLAVSGILKSMQTGL
ncbi:phage tail tape measure protein [Clostridium tagluense]|uniref:NlpC/P60 domain-containing protein n=1 Tax=Clostridium tagluense TaxID=360422 RepID=A0A401UPE6_9CLOT|nr:phage tail tape measure protein [Clostridium tagluense]GCD11412.1 hypothetical protein Ctaglu_30350 [Clostridium tagluense]